MRRRRNCVVETAPPYRSATETPCRKGRRVPMAQFIGTHQNRLDAKGRVSIPAQFRTVLKQMSHAGDAASVAPLVLRPSHHFPCIEGWTQKGFEALGAPLDNYDQFSP